MAQRLRPWEDVAPSEDVNREQSRRDARVGISPPPDVAPLVPRVHQLPRIEYLANKRPRLDGGQQIPASDNPNNHICCVPTCHGSQCQKIRRIAIHLKSEISTHEFLVHGSGTKEQPRPQAGVESPQVDDQADLAETLEQVAARLQQSNSSLQKLLLQVRGQKSPITSIPERLGLQSADQKSPQRSPQGQPSTNQLLIRVPQSHGPPPSPLSLVPMATQQSPLESTSSVHTAHLQDLQHSLSVKTLAFQTLQREFNSLLQKLERQRTKCATMEKKFEVSDAEIIGLSNEKDRLEENVEMLESQLEKMRNDRDEARRANSESAAQYLRIVEMAGRLQGKAGGGTTAESGKPWEKEREELLTRVKELESAAGVGSSSPLTPSSEKDTQIAEEVRNLRERNAKLEKGLASAKQAALLLAAQGQNVGMVLHKALEDD